MTDTPTPEHEVDRVLTALRLIIGMMLATIVMLGAAAAWWTRQTPPNFEPELDRLVFMFLFGAMLSAVVVLTILKLVFAEKGRHIAGEMGPAVIAGASRTDGALAPFLAPFQQWTLAQGVVAEGVGILGLVAHLITGHTMGLAAAAIAVAFLARIRPSRKHLERFAGDAIGRSS